MKRFALIILNVLLTLSALSQYPVTLKFQRNDKEVRDFGLLVFYEVDSSMALVRLPLRETQIMLPNSLFPDSNVVFLIQVRRRYYPFHLDRTNITQSMRWEFQWLTGKRYRRWAAQQNEVYPNCHAASLLTFHPLERGSGMGLVVRHKSSSKALHRAKQVVRHFLKSPPH